MYRFFSQIVCFISLLTTILFSTVAIAHSGHGGASELSHNLEHFLWLTAGVSILALVFYYRIKNKN